MVQPYLFFGGRCDEALEFYRTALGAEVQFLMRYNESPDPMPPGSIPPGFENKVMHSSIVIGESVLMMSDGNVEGTHFQGIQLSLGMESADEATKVFEALSRGGAVKLPLMKTFWSPLFGMLTDRFGLDWMINVEDAHGA